MITTTTALQLFPLQYGDHTIRGHVDDEGTCWWVAHDIGGILGLTNVRMSLESFPTDEKGVHLVSTRGGPQHMLTVNEPGLYRLIFHSRKQEAEAFKRWIFHDVLPALRRTGHYTLPAALPPPAIRQREHAEVSHHLLAVWQVLRHTAEPLTNQEIAHQAGVAPRTARAHTRYLVQLGLLDCYEIFPRHLYAVAEQADKRHVGYWQRLEHLSAIVQARQHIQ